MCEPATIAVLAGAAISAAGTAYTTSEQKKGVKRQVDARNDAAEAEIGRQEQFSKQAQESFADTLDATGADAEARRRAEAEARRTDNANNTISTAFDAPLSQSANPIVAATLNQKIGEKHAQTQNHNALKARQASFGDALFGGSQRINTGAQQLGLINGKSAGSARLLGLEQQAAGQQRGSSGIGDLLTGAGQVGLAAGTRV